MQTHLLHCEESETEMEQKAHNSNYITLCLPATRTVHATQYKYVPYCAPTTRSKHRPRK